MNERIKQERQYKLQGSVNAALEHLERGLAALEDANLYSNDDQEHPAANRLEDLMADICLYLL